MKPACRELFSYASQQVTLQDIRKFCPNDPGYPGYVREFSAILQSQNPPVTSNFEISETIGLTRWGDADKEGDDPARFRRFRTFTNTVGVILATGPGGPDLDMPPNFLAISLLDDAYALQDAHLLQLLVPVFGELHQGVMGSGWFAREGPFFLLGQMILALLGHAPSIDVVQLSGELVTEATHHAGRSSPEFLWGCADFDGLHGRWKHFVAIAFPEDSENEAIAELRDRLLPSPSEVA